jgi:hypothetical protein
MSQPTIAASAPTSLLRRTVTWWLAQVSHALPPTIFFFVGFNLILWTKRLILQEHGVEFSGFFTATLAALLVGKAVLATDNLPFMRRFDGAPLIQPILFKSVIYWMCVMVVRLAEELVHHAAAGGSIAGFGDHFAERFSLARFLSIQIWLMVLFLATSRYTKSTNFSATANCIACSSAGARPRPSLRVAAAFACSHVSIA